MTVSIRVLIVPWKWPWDRSFRFGNWQLDMNDDLLALIHYGVEP